MALKEGYSNLSYPPVYKDVDGYKCPEAFFTSYDVMSYDCTYCGRGKHYKSCSYVNGLQACFGWGHKEIGPMSCKGYVIFREDQKEFL
jgi:hypothetical protein